jgi:osmotically-inducible protein OsmY
MIVISDRLRKGYAVFGAVLSLGIISSCSPLGIVAGGAATVGVAAAQEGGIKRAVSDAQIQLYINDAWLRHDADLFRKLDLTINEGRVLITGVVQKPQHRVDAVRLAWQAPGVAQVINEIEVAESEGVKGFARDTLIASQLRAKITFDKEISSINYTIDGVGGNVYLMGVAQSEAELERVVNHARNLAYVKKVVSYVRIKDQEPISEAVPENVKSAGEPEFIE